MLMKTVLYLCIILASLKFCKEPGQHELLDGDLIFQQSESSQSRAIELASHSKYGHVGIIYKAGGEYFVFEAVQPVRRTSLKDFIANGRNSHYAVKRLKNRNLLLTPEVLARMKSEGEKFEGKNYDLYFNWSDEKIYCSELVWKIYDRGAGIEIGKLRKLRDYDLSSQVVREKLRERYGQNIPLNETVITPADIINSELLETVFEK